MQLGSTIKDLERARSELEQTKGTEFEPMQRDIISRLEGRVADLRSIADASVAIADDSDAFGERMKNLQGNLVGNANKAAQSLDEQAKKIKAQGEEAEKAKEHIENHGKASELAQKYQDNLNTALGTGYTKAGAIREAYQELTKDIAKLAEVSDQAAEKLLKLARAKAGGNAGGDLTDTISRAIDDAERTE